MGGAGASSVTRGAGVATWVGSVAKGDACAVAGVAWGTTVNPAAPATASGAGGGVVLDRITSGVPVASTDRGGANTDRHVSSNTSASRTDATPAINKCLLVMAGYASCYSVRLQRRQAVRIVT